MENAPTHLSLFSGIGGLDLAAEWAGFRTVGQCEFADYPTKVLEKHWPNVPRWRDIRTLTGDDFYKRTGLRTVDIISGGFPCQPFSSAGKQKGAEDNRFLWPEMLRVVGELHPSWVLGENVDGLLAAKFDETLRHIIRGLEAAGYYVRVFSFEAAQVGALHRRRRTFIVAHRYGGRYFYGKPKELTTEAGQPSQCEFVQCGDNVADTLRDRSTAGLTNSPRGQERQTAEPNNCGEVVANATGQMLQIAGQKPQFNQASKVFGTEFGGVFKPSAEGAEPERRITNRNQTGRAGLTDGSGWPAQPGLGRMVDGFSYWLDEPAGVPRVARGVKDRVSRIKGLGNAVVPQQAYPVFAAIYEIWEVLQKNGV